MITPVRLALVVTVAALPLMFVWSPVLVPVIASSLVLSAPAASVVALPALPLTAPTIVEEKVLTPAMV